NPMPSFATACQSMGPWKCETSMPRAGARVVAIMPPSRASTPLTSTRLASILRPEVHAQQYIREDTRSIIAIVHCNRRCGLLWTRSAPGNHASPRWRPGLGSVNAAAYAGAPEGRPPATERYPRPLSPGSGTGFPAGAAPPRAAGFSRARSPESGASARAPEFRRASVRVGPRPRSGGPSPRGCESRPCFPPGRGATGARATEHANKHAPSTIRGGPMAYETIDLAIRDGVAHLTLNRPQAANAINVELARDFMYAALQCDEDPSVRAVVLAGAGRPFCGGGGLEKFFGQGAQLPHHLQEGTPHSPPAPARARRPGTPRGAPPPRGAGRGGR